MIGKCTKCYEACNVVVADFGIGSYEYWGATGTDIQIEVFSDCCEAPVLDINYKLITPEMVKDYHRPDPENYGIC